jgi:hypothetical protein
MAEMMADGVERVEADMTFRGVETLEIRRREIVGGGRCDERLQYQG